MKSKGGKMNDYTPGDGFRHPSTYGLGSNDMAPVMSVGDWLITMLLMVIPFVNIILIIVWALDNNANPNRTNYAKALLIIIGIQILLMALFFGFIVGMVGSLAEMMS